MMSIVCIGRMRARWVCSSRGSSFLYSRIVLEWSQLGGVMPVMVMIWKSWNMVSWNACGMCLISTPGMLSVPGALWLGRSRRASLKIAGVSLPMIMCCVGGCGWDCVLPGECSVGVNVGVRGEPSRFYLFDDGYDLCGVICD